MFLKGFNPYKEEDTEKYEGFRWWAGLTFSDILDKAADIYPENTALSDGKILMTYSQVRDKVDRLAISMMRLGIKEQERVLVQLPNWNEFVYSYFAVQKIGAIPVLLIDRYRQYEINHLCQLTGATAWILPERYGKTDYLPIIDDVLNDNPLLKNIILVRGENHEHYSNLEIMIEDTDLTENSLFELSERRPHPLQVAHMAPTGGTTGIPKVVPRTHNDCLCGVEYAARAWELTSYETCLIAGPVGHDLSFTKGICGTIFTFGKMVILDSSVMEDICRIIEQEKVTAIVWVPTLASRLVNFEGLKNYDLSSLKKMHCGGGVSRPDMVRAVNEKLECTFYNGYGGTEGMSCLTRSSDDFETICSTVGKPTCPYDIYKVVDKDGNELPQNTSGELLIKGPSVFTGYYNSPEENEEVFEKDGFFRTGDLAIIDESGYITLTGRIKEMINRGAESISSVEIENLIITHPDIINVAVIGMPDPDMGERACAYIQIKPGANLNFEDIISYLKGQKASVLQLPERVEFIDDLPLTKAKKIDKSALMIDIKKKLGVS
ncbi:AMP-binding protein [Thermodesulfobacteriota bacterium]